MSQERWYRCGTGATACPRAESGEAFCVKENEYDNWKCPHSKFCKDSLIRLSWIDRHRREVTTLVAMALLLLLIGGGGLYHLSNTPNPEPAQVKPLTVQPPLALQPGPPPSVVQAPTVSQPEPPPVMAQQQPSPPPIQTSQVKNHAPNDGDRIGDKLRDVLKPLVPEALSLLPIQKFYFDINKSKLDAKLRPYLTEAVKELAKPEYKGKHLAVVGFADAKGTDKTNCPLSEARANTVTQELGKLSPIAVTPLGLCSTHPLGDNATPEGQQMNRRVELWVFDLQ